MRFGVEGKNIEKLCTKLYYRGAYRAYAQDVDSNSRVASLSNLHIFILSLLFMRFAKAGLEL